MEFYFRSLQMQHDALDQDHTDLKDRVRKLEKQMECLAKKVTVTVVEYGSAGPSSHR